MRTTHELMNDPEHVRACAVCGARAAANAVRRFTENLERTIATSHGKVREEAQAELGRLRFRELSLRTQGQNEHDNTGRLTEVVRQTRDREAWRRRTKPDQSGKAIEVFRKTLDEPRPRVREADNSAEAIEIFKQLNEVK